MLTLHRLWIKLALAFSLLVAVSVGLVSFIISQSTAQEFTTYVQGGGTHYFQLAADRLGAYYGRGNTWNDVDSLLASVQRRVDEGLLVADSRGVIVADTGGQQVGQEASAVVAQAQFPITTGDRQVGTLYVTSALPGRGGMGQGPARGRGPGGGPTGSVAPPPAPTPTLEDRYLEAVGRSVWITALAALVGAVAVSIVVARQVTGPLAALRRSARRIAAGDLTSRVDVRSQDEIGDLATSFNTMADALERNERARRNMVADVAHELKTPLTVIEGTADAVLDGIFQPTPETIQAIKDQAQLLAKLVDDLRELSLADAGQLKLERVPTAVGELIGQAVRSAEPAAREHGLRLETRVAPDLPTVNIDPARMRQVLSNLLSNAMRHTPAGGTVGIEARREGERVLMAVWDTGEGVPPEDLPFVFDRFYRADKSRARRSGGTGLGLAIVKQLVEAHGGQVWAESAPGHGSRFYVSLPLALDGS